MTDSKKKPGASKKKAEPEKKITKSGAVSKAKSVKKTGRVESKSSPSQKLTEKGKDQKKTREDRAKGKSMVKEKVGQAVKKKKTSPSTAIKRKENKDPVIKSTAIQGPPDTLIKSANEPKPNKTALRLKIKGPEEMKSILKERAKDLAEEPKQEDVGEGKLELVEFILAYEKYGIESSYVREVYPLKEFTPVPCTPSFLFGITNVRGKLISVMDIKEFFGLPVKGLTDLNRTIIVRTPQMEVGILADAIVGVRMVPLNEIQTSLPTLTDRRSEYLRGVTQDRLVILDINKILTDPSILINEIVEI